MALILGLVIATPIELRIFEKEINAEIQMINANKNDLAQRTFNQTYSEKVGDISSQISYLSDEIVNKNQEVERYRIARDKAHKAMTDEAEGLSATGKRGEGDIYKQKREYYEKTEKEYNEKNREYLQIREKNAERIAQLRSTTDNIEVGKLQDLNEVKTLNQRNDGLMARLNALNKLSSESIALWFAKWLITFLFIVIEIAPILFKMMTESGPYDERVEVIKYQAQIAKEKAKSDLNDSTMTDVTLSHNLNLIEIERSNSETERELEIIKEKKAVEITLQKELVHAKFLADKEIGLAAVGEWKKTEADRFSDPMYLEEFITKLKEA
jgi:hypothetical protein